MWGVRRHSSLLRTVTNFVCNLSFNPPLPTPPPCVWVTQVFTRMNAARGESNVCSVVFTFLAFFYYYLCCACACKVYWIWPESNENSWGTSNKIPRLPLKWGEKHSSLRSQGAGPSQEKACLATHFALLKWTLNNGWARVLRQKSSKA